MQNMRPGGQMHHAINTLQRPIPTRSRADVADNNTFGDAI
jgi:hypothetical protein